MIIRLSREELFAELREAVEGEVLLPDHQDFDKAIRLWNAAVKIRPAAVALCQTVNDVVAVLSVARQYRWPVAVKGGGHDGSGLALVEDGIVIDLSRMRRVTIDAAKKEAVLEGGATAGDLLAAAGADDLLAVTGASSKIGMAGLTMGGGYGPLTPKYGLVLDQLLSAVLVLADGRVVTASDTEHADLFWAIRGGGGNFGVVVSMTMRLYHARPVLSGIYTYAWDQAAAIMKNYNENAWKAPEELSVITALGQEPDGTPVMRVALSWCGDPQSGEILFSRLKGKAVPLSEKVQLMRYSDMLAEFDLFIVNDCYNEMKTRWLPDLTNSSLEIMMQATANMSSVLSGITLQYFCGKPTRTPLAATAFGLRKPHILVLINAAWEAADDIRGAAHRKWAADLCNELSDGAFPGGYTNVLTVKDKEQVLYSHGSNLTALQQVKSHYDPEGVFSSFPISTEEISAQISGKSK